MLSLQEKIGQLITHLVYGADAGTPDERNRELYGVATPAEVITKYRFGGVIYFAWAGNTEDPQQIGRLSKGLQAAARQVSPIPLIIGTDQETGRVARMGPPATQFPGAMALAATHSTEAVRQAYAITGTELRTVGINADFAPVADVNVNQANPVIGIRSFGSEPDVVAEHVAAGIAGLQLDAGIAAAAKHFPGHGDTGADSHHALPVITHSVTEWEAVDAPPFAAAVRAGVDLIMTGHLAFPELDPTGDPATLSRPILTGLLREHLGFTGVVITDSLRMQGVRELYDDGEIAVRCIEAGVDILLEPADPDAAVAAITEAVRSGRLTEQRIDESVNRILELKRRRGLFEAASPDPQTIARVVGSQDHLDRARRITDAGITVIRDDALMIPLERESITLLGSDAEVIGRLSVAFKAAGREVIDMVTGPNPDQDVIDTAVHLARESHQTVIVTSAAWRSRWQRRLVRAIRESVPRVALIAVTEPYDAGLVTGGGTLVLTYSATPASIDAVTRLLLGQRRPTGRLPVTVGENIDHPLFPFGAGTA
jgi:beta-N-acetylhexosaminidase